MTVTSPEAQAARTKRLAGKVALVTGGSRGIGAGIALRLAEEGAHVAISYARNKSSADQIVQKLAKHNVGAMAFQADATSEEQTRKLIDEVVKEFGRIDILVNNAGVFEGLSLENMTVDHYQRVFDVNVKGVIATTIAALKRLPEGGRIISISSVAATSSAPNFSVYSASKAALETLTRSWAQELGARRITVNGVAPGATVSDMYESVPEEMKREMISRTALGRVGHPEDIAAVVAFLASEDGGWITGQTIVVSGGINF